MATKQERLLPDVKAEIRSSQTRAANLMTDGSLPSRVLTDSVERLGVLQPVIVRPADKDGDYEVLAGNRRAEAAKSISHDMDVPIAVIANAPELGDDLSYVITLIENGMRSPNPLAEVDALHALFASGASETAIARETGLSVPTIRKRLRLERLHPAIKAGVQSGGVALGVAMDAAALPAERQDELADLLAARNAARAQDASAPKATLSQADVDQVKLARAAAAAAEIPAALFEVPPLEQPQPVGASVPLDQIFDEAADSTLSAEEQAVAPWVRAVVQAALGVGMDVNALAKLVRRQYRVASDAVRP